MVQAGLFVSADSFTADVRTRLFTHYRREEDTEMESGKLDEELARMNDIASLVTPGAMVLFNESFAATNEREGSEIGCRSPVPSWTLASRFCWSPTCSTSPTACTSGRRRRARCSCVPSAGRTAGVPSAWRWGNRCRPASARACTGTSSANPLERLASRGESVVCARPLSVCRPRIPPMRVLGRSPDRLKEDTTCPVLAGSPSTAVRKAPNSAVADHLQLA